MARHEHPISVSDAEPGLSERLRARKKRYFILMGLCFALIIPAWTVVRLYSVPLAVGMSMVAMIIPPIAAIVANPLGRDD